MTWNTSALQDQLGGGHIYNLKILCLLLDCILLIQTWAIKLATKELISELFLQLAA